METLKGRLDSLRKAKNTTIVHREREEVRISSPYFGRVQTSSHSLGRLPSLRNGEARPQTSQECSHQEVKELNAQVYNYIVPTLLYLSDDPLPISS